MNPSTSSHYSSSFLSPTPDPASSAALQTPAPFIATTQATNGLYLSQQHPFGRVLQGPSFVQSPPSPTNTMPSISVQREAQAQAPFQAVDLSLSRTNGPTDNYQSHASPSPLPQHPPFPCNDSSGTDLKEKRPPRPSNAFILFRSDSCWNESSSSKVGRPVSTSSASSQRNAGTNSRGKRKRNGSWRQSGRRKRTIKWRMLTTGPNPSLFHWHAVHARCRGMSLESWRRHRHPGTWSRSASVVWQTWHTRRLLTMFLHNLSAKVQSPPPPPPA